MERSLALSTCWLIPHKWSQKIPYSCYTAKFDIAKVGETMAHLAARYNRVQVLDFLSKKKFSLNPRNKVRILEDNFEKLAWRNASDAGSGRRKY